MLLQLGLHLVDFALLVLQDEIGGCLQRGVAAQLQLGPSQGNGVLVVSPEQGGIVAVGAARAGILGRPLKIVILGQRYAFLAGCAAIVGEHQKVWGN